MGNQVDSKPLWPPLVGFDQINYLSTGDIPHAPKRGFTHKSYNITFKNLSHPASDVSRSSWRSQRRQCSRSLKISLFFGHFKSPHIQYLLISNPLSSHQASICHDSSPFESSINTKFGWNFKGIFWLLQWDWTNVSILLWYQSHKLSIDI